MSFNIQSLPSKFDEFSELIKNIAAANSSPDVICLQETWNIPDFTVFHLPGYKNLCLKNHSKTNSGEVGIYIKENLPATLLQ